jgi:hypothetical protein
VYFGPLGLDSQALIDYFEGQGVCPIEPGDNPANWMLRELPKGEKDYADLYQESPEHSTLKRQLETARTDPPKELEIWYQSDFAVPTSERQRLMNKRLQTIYWRSPTYNLSRLLVCIIIAFILGSVFITQRQLTTLTESELRAYFSVTFLSFIIIGILCITSVLPVMLAIRDVFYKQRAAGMVDNTALGWALGTAEKWFMILCSFLFCLVYLSVAGTFPMTIRRAIKFWVRFLCLPEALCEKIGLTLASIFVSASSHTAFIHTFTGILHIQLGYLLLFWTSFHVSGSSHGNGPDLIQRFHRTEQFLFRAHCSTPIHDGTFCIHILDHSWTLRLRRSNHSTILG